MCFVREACLQLFQITGGLRMIVGVVSHTQDSDPFLLFAFEVKELAKWLSSIISDYFYALDILNFLKLS